MPTASPVRTSTSAGRKCGRPRSSSAATSENLERLADLLSGRDASPIQATYELAQAPDALAALSTTHTRGKVAIRVA